jgi:hypothetical protein
MLAPHQSLKAAQRLHNGGLPRSVVSQPQLETTRLDSKIGKTSKIIDIDFGYHRVIPFLLVNDRPVVQLSK